MAACETSESTSSPAVGIILVLIACLCYSFGNNLQRYSLLRQPGELVFGCLNRNLGWLLGACIYFSANGLFSVALSFAPVSLLSAVFSLTIVTNAACAVYFLGDKVPRLAYPGYFFVLLGAIIFAVSFQAEVCHFDGSELIVVMTTPQALTYWVILGLVIVGGSVFARLFEKKYPVSKEKVSQSTQEIDAEDADADKQEDPEINDKQTPVPDETENVDEDIPPKILLSARLIYPSSLGAIETAGYLILKAFNSLLTSAASGEEVDGKVADQDYPNDIVLWIVLGILGAITFVGIILFLRLTYSRFEITGAFPVEFGVLTFASVVGGFAVFQDYNYVTEAVTWVYISLASVSILGGIALVGYASWRASLEKPTETDLREEGSSSIDYNT